MNNRSRRVLHLVAGMYLIYLSFTLISQQLKEATSNTVVAWAAGIGFAVFGVYLIINYVRTSVKDYHEQENQEAEVIEETTETVEEE